jgi:hypothetical protein
MGRGGRAQFLIQGAMLLAAPRTVIAFPSGGAPSCVGMPWITFYEIGANEGRHPLTHPPSKRASRLRWLR